MDSIPQTILGLLWPPDGPTQIAVALLFGFALLALLSVHLPLGARLLRIGKLQRAVQACFDQEGSNQTQRKDISTAFADSPLAFHWSEFVRRWQNAIAADPIQDASVPELSRAPVRLADVFDEHPIIEAGARRSLLPAVPAILLSTGLLGAFAGLVLALPGISASLGTASGEVTRAEQIASLMLHLGMALRIGLWGLVLSLAAAITGRILEGRAERLTETLDSWVQLAYGSISTAELTTRAAHEQRASIDRLQEEVAELSRQVSSRPRPLIRSTARVPGAGPVESPELSAKALEKLGSELGAKLEHKLEEQMAALRASIRTRDPAPPEPNPHDERIEAGLAAVQSAIAALANRPADAAPTSVDTSALESSVSSLQRSVGALGDRLESVAATLRSELVEQARRTSDALEPSAPTREAIVRATDTLPIAPRSDPASDVTAYSAEHAQDEYAGAEMPGESSESQTLPYMKAPTVETGTESLYSAGLEQTEEIPPRRPSPTMGGSTLSGLLRATHHSGPSQQQITPPDDFEARDRTEEHQLPEETSEPEPDESGVHSDAPPRRKLFGRRR